MIRSCFIDDKILFMRSENCNFKKKIIIEAIENFIISKYYC